jgi:hypothetical protein
LERGVSEHVVFERLAVRAPVAPRKQGQDGPAGACGRRQGRVVIGEPATEMMPPVNDWATLVTEPVPAAAQLPSPRQNVDAVAPVPLFKLVTGRLPVTPVVSGKPVALVRVPLAGVPRSGVTRVGLLDNTTLPVPVLVTTPVPPLATAKVPAKVIAPAVAVFGVRPVVPALNVVTPPAAPLEARVIRPCWSTVTFALV